MAPFFSWVAKVPDVIGTLKQVGKTTVGPEAGVRTAPAGGSVACTKKFEVQFRGRVSMENNNTPPSLIDECVEWLAADHGRDFWAKQVPRMSDHTVDLVTASAKMAAQIKLLFQPSSRGAQEKVACVREAGLVGSHTPCPPGGQEGVELQQNPCVPSPKGRCKSSSFPEHYQSNPSRPGLIQPTITLENRPVLLMIGQAEIYIMSPDTKKVIVERSFSEMSFCSQGIRHLDHFGFVCREPHEMVSWQWVCYIFQAYAENLVDEIILPLKQAFSVATRTPHPWTQSPQCCPKQQLHQLCGRIQGLHPTSAKLELQKHIATLDSHQQASILEGALASKPKTEQEEIEVLLSSLHFYEEQQKNHQYNQNGVVKQTGRGEALPEPGVKVREKAREVLGEQQRRPQSEPLEVLWKVSGAFKPAVCSSREAESISYPAITPSCSISTSSRNFPSSTKEGFLDLLPSSPHMSKGDPTQAGLLSREYQHLGFRRRASTYSHPARHHNPGSITPQEPIASIKPRLVRHNSVGTDRACHSCDVAASSSHHHTVPWRQQIFLRVAVSQKSCNAPPGYTTKGATSVGGGYPEAGLHGECPRVEDKDRGRRRVSLVRERWRKAILQQILLLRMEKENQKLQATESDLQNKRLKLGYEEITPCLKDVTMVWEQMLGTPGRSKVQFDTEKVHNAVWQGVPRTHRGEIWQFLSEQHLLRQRVSCRHPDNEAPYRDLLGQLSSQQHAILIDLGRTFPTHPYFSAKLGSGQHSLYNLLKAYSLLDSEVGYCQGLSFVAGVLLLHMDEEEAFGMLTFLMYKMGLRKQYRPDMIILQIQMYQLSRLLHDYHRDLYSHLEKHNIGPSLYATPWFLTVFASHFPLGFVARVFDMVFLQGSDAIFKVALSLLGSHKPLIMQHNNLEAIVDFIKTTLPKLGLVQMEKTINQVFEMDLSKQLQAYEVEYHVLQDQLLEAPTTLSQQQRMAQMERANRCLRQQNLDLLEELQVAHAKLDSLEANVTELLSREGGLQQKIGALEQERASLLKMVAELRAEPPNSTSAPPPGGNGCTPDPPHQPGPNNSHCPQ